MNHLTSDWILAGFSKRKNTAQIKYREFIDRGKGQPFPWQSLKNQVYLVSDRKSINWNKVKNNTP